MNSSLQPINYATIELVELGDDGQIGRLTPHCKIHRAMNKVTADGMWRCLSDYSIIKEIINKHPIIKVIENKCRAGCLYNP